jgi:hypothetical protein
MDGGDEQEALYDGTDHLEAAGSRGGNVSGPTAGQVRRTLGIADQTLYRWRRKYGGLKLEQGESFKHFYQLSAEAVEKGHPPIISFLIFSLHRSIQNHI